jgi:hypothetical protein
MCAFSNSTPAPVNAQVNLLSSFIIESEVFNGVTDPETGEPLNGAFNLALGTCRESHSIGPNATEDKRMTLSRGCGAGLVNRPLLRDLGLSETQITTFLHKPITIRVGVLGTLAAVSGLSLSYGVRFYGD